MSAAIQGVNTPVKENKWSNAVFFFRNMGKSLYSWQWTKALVYWLILSAGTASDLVFLMASFWMSVNANVHGLILRYMSEDTATYVTYLATTAYVALPIFIVGLAVVQAVGHIKMWKTGGFWSKTWAIIFGIPAITFLVMDFVTISCSVANVTFTMPMFFVILRADSAFIFAFGSLIFFFLGKPQEKERLQEKDLFIANMKQENAIMVANLQKENAENIARFQKEIADIKAEWQRDKMRLTSDWQHETAYLKAELEEQKELLDESKRQQTALLNAVNKSSESALQGYTEECMNWLKSGEKSVSLEDIIRYSGHSKRKIQRAITSGILQPSTRNKDLILMSSVVKWLKQTPAKTDTEPDLYVVNG